MQTQRKLVLMFIAVILAFSVLLTACTKSTDKVVTSANPSGKPADTTEKHDPVTITMSWWGTDDRNKAIATAVKLFEQKYNWITVKGTGQGWDGYHDKLVVRLASKKAPDVFAYSTNYIEQFSEGNLLVNLTDRSDALPYLPEITDFTSQYLKDGKLYGLPAGSIYGALVFDKQIFDDAKVAYPTAEDTTVTLYAKLAQIHKNNPKIWGEPGGLPEGFIDQMGGSDVIDYSTNPPTVHLEPTKAKKYLDFYEQQWAAGSSPGDVVDQIGIANGNSAITVTNVAGLAGLIASTKHELGIIQPPRRFDSDDPKEVAPPSAPAFWGIPSTSKHIDEALLLLNFLQTDHGAVKEIGLNFGTPVVPASLDYYSTEVVQPGSLNETIMNIAKNYVAPGFTIKKPGPLKPPGYGEAIDAFNVVMQKYAQKQVNQEQFLAETEKMMNEKLRGASKNP